MERAGIPGGDPRSRGLFSRGRFAIIAAVGDARRAPEVTAAAMITNRPLQRGKAGSGRALILLLLSLLLLAAPAVAGPDRRASDPNPPTQREVVERTMEILNRPEFAGSDEDEVGLLLILSNLLSDFVDGVKRLRRTNPALYGTIVGWLVATLLIIVGHVAWTVWRGTAGSRARGPSRASPFDPALATRAGRDPDRMVERADREAAAGRPGDAVPWLYLALLFRLERAGRLEFDPARTGLEYADALARRPADRSLWLGFLDRHDPVVFGGRAVAADDLADLRARALAPLPEDARGGA